jgi:hypothetical protein
MAPKLFLKYCTIIFYFFEGISHQKYTFMDSKEMVLQIVIRVKELFQ